MAMTTIQRSAPPPPLLRFVAICILLSPAPAFICIAPAPPPPSIPSTSPPYLQSASYRPALSTRRYAGLSWRSAQRYKHQPPSPVIALVTKDRAYAKGFRNHFGSLGYLVQVLSPTITTSTTTTTSTSLSKLIKLVDGTQPEAIVIDEQHVPRKDILAFMEGTKENPDLWLVPVLVLLTTTTTATGGISRGDDHHQQEERHGYLAAGVHGFLSRGKGEEDTSASAAPSVSSWEDLHGVMVGRGGVRRRMEKMVTSMQEAILDLRVHRRPLLPSTIIIMDDDALRPLSDRQQEVLNLVARGLTDSQIAHSIQVGVGSVRVAVKKLMTMYKADTRCELVRIALDNDLLTE